MSLYIHSINSFYCIALIHAVTVVLSVHAQMSFVTHKSLLVLVTIVVIFFNELFLPLTCLEEYYFFKTMK